MAHNKRALLDWLMRMRARSKADLVSPILQRGERVLDLGAAEGFVAERLSTRLGLETELVDVLDMNRTSQPHCVYDGRRLPFESNSFDAVIAIYVLHHTDNAAEVVSEALRVASRCVIILESTYKRAWERPALERIDRFLNRLRSEGTMDEGPLSFRTSAEWVKFFSSLKTNIIVHRDLGGFIHHRSLFVLDAADHN